jgi:putative holliday junction resolvase
MPEGRDPGGATAKRILSFDYGEKRIGVAAGDTLTRHAQPVATLTAQAGGPDWRGLERTLDEWRPELIVLGIPYNMDGTEGRLTGAARAFGRELERRFGLKVMEVDERLSSREAAERLAARRASGRMKRRVKRADLDAEAACVLLEQWLGGT